MCHPTVYYKRKHLLGALNKTFDFKTVEYCAAVISHSPQISAYTAIADSSVARCKLGSCLQSETIVAERVVNVLQQVLQRPLQAIARLT